MAGRSSDTKLVSTIVDRNHDKIALGEYSPGDRLRQELLAEEFKVSRTPIREALRLLEAKGVMRRRTGTVPSSGGLRLARSARLQVRAELEGLATELAAQWISDSQIEDLRTIHASFVKSVKELSGQQRNGPKRTERSLLKASNIWIDTNGQFHSLIQTASNNLRLRQVISELYVGFTRNVMYSSARGMDAHRMQQNIDHHEEILRALEKRNAERARQAMQMHVLESGKFVIAWLENHMST